MSDPVTAAYILAFASLGSAAITATAKPNFPRVAPTGLSADEKAAEAAALADAESLEKLRLRRGRAETRKPGQVGLGGTLTDKTSDSSINRPKLTLGS